MEQVKNDLKMNAILVEYPGYGIYANEEPCENQIKLDACAVFDHLTHTFKIDQKKILIFGRSLGSGPACYLSSKTEGILGLVLMSAFKSIK